MNVRGGLRVFSVVFWHSDGWTPKNEALLEAVLKQATTTRHPWLKACDANMCPEDFEKSLWFQRETMHVVALRGVSTCRSKGPKDEWIERTNDYVIASGSLKGKIFQMEVVEDFESRPHRAVSFCGKKREGDTGIERQKLRKVLPGYSGGRLSGRSTKEKGKEEGEVNEDGGERRIRSQIAQEVVVGIKEKVRVHGGENCDVQRLAEQSFMRSWDCSQIEN